MIPVEQRLMFDAETGQRGDCLKCALASILELDYEDVPHFAEMENWASEMRAWLAGRNLLYLTIRSHEPTAKPEITPGAECFWLADVVSRRVESRCYACSPDDPGFMLDGTLCQWCKGWGKTKGEHVVVMQGPEVAWDPHPLREQGHGGFVRASVLVQLDPARLTLPFARVEEPMPEDLERLLRNPDISIPGDEHVAEMLAEHLRANPEATVTRGAYLHLWATFKRMTS